MKREDCRVGDVLAIPDQHGRPQFFRVIELRTNGPLMTPISKQEAEQEMTKLAEAERLSQTCNAMPMTIN